MSVSRRTVLQGLAATAFCASPALASIQLGSANLTTISDGHLVLPGSFAFGPMPQAELTALLADLGVPSDRATPECNLALYRDGTNNVLFDVGSGPDFMPTAGTCQDALADVGLSPDDITHVVFTHGHPDHLWGLLDDFDDPVFTNATYMMGRAEWEYWWNPETVNTIDAARQSFAVGAKRRLDLIEDQITLFDDGAEILPGIEAVSTPGHTPGHMAFELRQNTDSVMILGDAITNPHVGFRRPHWPSGSDQNAELGAQTRHALLDRLVHQQSQLIGFHLPGGGIGRAEKGADGYTFVPEGT